MRFLFSSVALSETEFDTAVRPSTSEIAPVPPQRCLQNDQFGKGLKLTQESSVMLSSSNLQMLSFSFGIVMWEVATRNKPYEGVYLQNTTINIQPETFSVLASRTLYRELCFNL